LEERFQSRGGLLNLDIFQWALVRKDLEYVILLGEGTSHQLHGGVATNVPERDLVWTSLHDGYVGIRGLGYVRLTRTPRFLGQFPPETEPFARLSRQAGEILWKKYPAMIQ
jgi:hypothetical protein